MDLEQDLNRIAAQEAALSFGYFDSQVAWDLGSRLRSQALSASLAIACDVTFAGTVLFSCAMNGATPDNMEWIRRKKNVVARFHKSSYAVALELLQRGATLESRAGTNAADFVAAGGCFPIRLRASTGVVGSVTVSGLAQRDDHSLVVTVLCEYLGIDPNGLSL